MESAEQRAPATASTSTAARKRQRRTIEQKRQIVAESLAPGASVARVARVHGVNANQVFLWRRQYQAGQLGGTGSSPVGLLSVSVAEPPTNLQCVTPVSSTPGTIHLKLPQAQVRIDGSTDAVWLRMVLECLLR
jgi:transposase